MNPVTYAGWRPAHTGAALHLVDLENIAGHGCVDHRTLVSVLAGISELASMRPGDTLVVATNPTQADALGPVDGARVVVGEGRDGADLALLGSVAHDRLDRYSRVVLATGDHIFSDLAQHAREAGCRVEVIAHPTNLSRRLAGVVDAVRDAPRVRRTRRRRRA